MRTPSTLHRTECRDCIDGFEHCHGTYVLHDDGTWECTEPGCVGGGAVLHLWVVSCVEVGAQCLCRVDGYAATA